MRPRSTATRTAARAYGAFLGAALASASASAQDPGDGAQPPPSFAQAATPVAPSTPRGSPGQRGTGLEPRVKAALARAASALAAEEARMDEKARRNLRSRFADGTPSVAQVWAHIRHWELQIRVLETSASERLERTRAVLKSLKSDIRELAARLSAPTGAEPGAHEALRAATLPAPPPATPSDERTDAPPLAAFQDCAQCPRMREVPSGRFDMGSPASEPGRSANEGPVHQVTIGYRLAVSVHEVTRREFERFVSEESRFIKKWCKTVENGKRVHSRRHDWRAPGFEQDERHPVTCVTWKDAKAYARWLSKKAGKPYRLLTESEWEYVARAGTDTPHYWGTRAEDRCRHANGADADPRSVRAPGCDDGHAHTSPAGAHEANGFGLHDLSGNVSEWVEDCWSDDYRRAPTDGGAWDPGGCRQRVFRGGSWHDGNDQLRSAARRNLRDGHRSSDIGFRVARTLDP